MIITSLYTSLHISTKLVVDIVVSIHNYDEPQAHLDAPSVLSQLTPCVLQSISRPLVSTGKRMHATPARNSTSSNTSTASIWWQFRSMPTATSGQITPPILPMAVAIPTPVERTDVGYTQKENDRNNSLKTLLFLPKKKALCCQFQQDLSYNTAKAV